MGAPAEVQRRKLGQRAKADAEMEAEAKFPLLPRWSLSRFLFSTVDGLALATHGETSRHSAAVSSVVVVAVVVGTYFFG